MEGRFFRCDGMEWCKRCETVTDAVGEEMVLIWMLTYEMDKLS